MLYNNLHFFSSKCRLFHNATLFGFCITHILNTGCAKIWKKKIVAKRLIRHWQEVEDLSQCCCPVTSSYVLQWDWMPSKQWENKVQIKCCLFLVHILTRVFYLFICTDLWHLLRLILLYGLANANKKSRGQPWYEHVSTCHIKCYFVSSRTNCTSPTILRVTPGRETSTI